MRMAGLHYGLGLPRADNIAVTNIPRLPGTPRDKRRTLDAPAPFSVPVACGWPGVRVYRVSTSVLVCGAIFAGVSDEPGGPGEILVRDGLISEMGHSGRWPGRCERGCGRALPQRDASSPTSGIDDRHGNSDRDAERDQGEQCAIEQPQPPCRWRGGTTPRAFIWLLDRGRPRPRRTTPASGLRLILHFGRRGSRRARAGITAGETANGQVRSLGARGWSHMTHSSRDRERSISTGASPPKDGGDAGRVGKPVAGGALDRCHARAGLHRAFDHSLGQPQLGPPHVRARLLVLGVESAVIGD